MSMISGGRASPWVDGSRYHALSWSSDQPWLVFVRSGIGASPRVLWRIPVSGGSAIQMGVSMAARIKSPAMHPDGKRLVFAAIDADNSEIWALENFLKPGAQVR